MNEENTMKEQSTNPARESALIHKLEATGWGLFFIWIGIVILGNIEGGWAILGVGLITLAMQLIRRSFGLKMDGFWVVVGTLFTLGGIWDVTGTTLPLIAVLCLIAGGALLLKGLKQ